MPEREASATHLVLIPSFNTGPLVVRTVNEVLQAWSPVWVVLDGSTDGTPPALAELASADPRLRVISCPTNRGKGAAVLTGLKLAAEAGFSHALTFDADGQHPASHITTFMQASRENPGGMVLGVPVFAADAPALRVGGRKISNCWVRLETGGAVADSLFGFRVYPVEPLIRIMERTGWMRRFDFDPEAAVRLCWAGVRPVNLPAPVRYLSREQGGVSHFRYTRDNALLTVMHIRLMVIAILLHLPTLLRLGRRRNRMLREAPRI